MIAILLWILRILVIAFVIRIALRFLTGQLFSRRVSSRGRQREVIRQGGALVRDPQCGTYVPMSSAVTSGAGAARQHFCSVACRDAWTAAHA